MAETLNFFAKMAVLTFEHYGNHVPMLFILNDRQEPIDMLSTTFEDQTDKFIFWRNVADRIASLKASGLVWISESWLRSIEHNNTSAVRNMPITGEMLQVLTLDRSGQYKQMSWNILRILESAKPTLQPILEIDWEESSPFFLVPAMRAMDVPDLAFVTDERYRI